MLESHVLPYIEQSARRQGAIGFDWEPEIVRILLPNASVKELAANQRLYVPLYGLLVNSSRPQQIVSPDYNILTVKSPTAEIKITKGQFLPNGYDVIYMNGVEHSGTVSFNYADADNTQGFGLGVYVIIATFHFKPTQPCPPLTNC